jgi:hypothetical protein
MRDAKIKGKAKNPLRVPEIIDLSEIMPKPKR